MGLLAVAEHMGRRALHARGWVSRRVPTRAGELHVYDAKGSGALPTTVVLHGIGSAATPYGRVMQGLRSLSRRVLAPEAPGHGFSGEPRAPLDPDRLRDTYVELFDRVLDEPAVLVGNSLGGAVALGYATEHPERVAALVLTSPAGAQLEDHELEALLASFRMRSTRDARDFARRLYHEVPWYVPLVARDMRAIFDRRAIRDFTASVRREHLLTPEQLARLTMPILVVWGRSDALLPRSSLDFFRRTLPAHAVVEEVDGLGHCPHLERPRWLVERIARFARAEGLL